MEGFGLLCNPKYQPLHSENDKQGHEYLPQNLAMRDGWLDRAPNVFAVRLGGCLYFLIERTLRLLV